MAWDAAEIKSLLGSRAESLARELVPDGVRSGHYWIARCPWRGDANAGSFWINLPGQGVKVPGSWRDAATDEKGSALDLVMKVHGLDFKGALQWSASWLGLSDMPAAERKQRLEREQRRQVEAVASEAEDLDKARRWALAKYIESRKRPFVGSAADTYLKSRGIDVRRLGRMPGVLGWLPEQRHHESGARLPVMLAGIQNDDGETIGIHRTFLRPDGSAKADVAPQRKVWPRGLAGGVIRLWRGENKVSIAEACKSGLAEKWVICEGVEDGLSSVLADPGPRVVCAVSLTNLAHVRLAPCCWEVVVWQDNDWSKPQARRDFDKAIAALARQCPRIAIARSAIGKDANDALRGEG